ncbi:MFS transporter [Acrocarpospora phusangensis]|uniref:MFS transporter n=1 Tax=Acrocarpospora phusangensis TaxID=1070424 RepID=A0A919Q8A4_9ACTN|nr:MFS transporter [Acrocarpospora phusangensis]GIH24041.1 MFS transporter [Acrocarpospora phusangensis]
MFDQRYRALSIGMVALFMLVAFEYLAVATAMPAVAAELNGNHLYSLAFSGGVAAALIATVLGGRWGDVRGPGAPLWTGLVAFLAGLTLAGAAPVMEVFLLGRFLQGFGGGMFDVAIYVLVGRIYPAAMHPRVFSLLAAAWVLPSVVGPAITGFVTEHFSWRWVFLAVPILAAPAVFALWRGLAGTAGQQQEAVTEEPADTTDGGFRLRVAMGVLAAIGAGLLQYGSGSENFVLIAAGLVVLAASLPRLLPPGTMRAARGLPSVVALRGIAAGSFLAAEVLVPLVLFDVRGLSPDQGGIALTGGALFWSLGSWIQGRKPYRRKSLLAWGCGLIALGMAVTAPIVVPEAPVWLAFVGWSVAGLGIGVVYPVLSVLVLELSAPGEQGKNSASLAVGESVLTIVAIAVTGAIFTVSAAYALCFALLVTMAAAGVLLAGRVTMEV